ncbi:MAG: chloride channel protein [Aquificae bacterium]|nr:chloride channel protein [Aquificota bacterium]
MGLKRFLINFFLEGREINLKEYIKSIYQELLSSPSMKIDFASILFFLGRWLPFSIAIGITTGVIASVMDLFVVNINKFLSQEVVYFFVYPLLVAFIVGKVIQKYPEVEGPGIGFAVLHLKTKKYIPFKVIFYKLVVSVLTLSGGFIAGREGPSFFLGVAIGEWTGKIYGFGKKYKNLLGLIGGGAFTGALLKAPLGSSIFAMELENMYDFDYRPFIPMIIAAIVSYLTFSFFRGNHHFIELHSKPIWNLDTIPYIVIMGLVISAVIYVYTLIFHFFQKFSKIFPPAKRPIAGTLAAIPILLFLYLYIHSTEILSAPANMKILSDLANNSFPIDFDVLIILGTIFVTSLTLAFGISGGLILPVLIIGSAVGNIFGHFFPKELITFTLAGMASALAAAAKTPLAAIVMITEMSHDDVVIPMTAAVITSYLTSFGYSTYLGQKNIFRGNLRTFSVNYKKSDVSN